MKFSFAPSVLLAGFALSPFVTAVHADTDSLQKSAPATQDGERAINKIQDVANQLTSIVLTKPNPTVLKKRLGSLLDQNFDLKYMSNYALGRYRNQATANQRKEYEQLYKQALINTLAPLLARSANQQLDVKRASFAREQVIVSSQLQQANGIPPVNIRWVLRREGDDFHIIDVVVQGISLIGTQRVEFSSIINRNGSSIETLLTVLRQRAGRPKVQPSATES